MKEWESTPWVEEGNLDNSKLPKEYIPRVGKDENHSKSGNPYRDTLH